jgi:primase-polymerase (primpol)-like protein
MGLTQRHPAFQLLEPYRKFVVYKTRKRAGSSRKLDKFPVDPATGMGFKGWDQRENWLGLEEAFAHAEPNPSLGVGFVFSAEDDLHFLDIDECVINDAGICSWTPYALSLVKQFDRAFAEISISGRGLHVIFRASGLPDHATQRKDLGLEFYSHARFCACTGNCWSGDGVLPDHRLPGLALTELFAKPLVPSCGELRMVDRPLPTPPGPENDDPLIKRLLDDEW